MPDTHLIPTGHLNCADDEAHVWRVDLDCTQAEFGALETVLSVDERVRASGFKTAEMRRRWSAARGTMRIVLAAYLETVPESLVFTISANGKPKLATSALSFNISHTAHLAFVAIAVGEVVGIDAEIVRSDFDWEGIGRRFLARDEVNEIMSLAPEIRTRSFFACWTRKEAYLKAMGFGLDAALDKFHVNVRPDEAPRLLWEEGSPDVSRQWSFHDLSEPGVAVALAVKPSKSVVRRFAFSVPSDRLTRVARQ